MSEPDDDPFLRQLTGPRVGTQTYAAMAALEARLAAGTAAAEVIAAEALGRVCAALGAENSRREAGLPTCVCVSRFVGVGTSHGVVLVFDNAKERLEMILPPPPALPEHCCGPVTCVDVPEPHGPAEPATVADAWLLAGYQGGAIVLWDVAKGAAVRSLQAAHDSPVASVRWLRDARAVSVGTQGTALVHAFGVRLFIPWDDRAPLQTPQSLQQQQQSQTTGRRRALLAMEPLLPGNAQWSADALSLVAAANAACVFLVATPAGTSSALCPRAVLPAPREDAAEALPYIAWRRATKAASSDVGRDVDPALAVAWGASITVAQLSLGGAGDAPPTPEDVEFDVVCTVRAHAEVTGVTWMGTHALAYTTTKDRLHVVDPFAQQDVDSIDIKHMELVYHSRFISPATGNPLIAYHAAMRRLRARLYFLGIGGVWRVHLRHWDASVQALIDKGQWIDAMAFLLSLYEGRTRMAVDIPLGQEEMRAATASKLIEVLRKFICVALGKSISAEEDGVARAKQDLELCSAVTLCAIRIGRPLFIFEELMPLLADTGRLAIFYDQLEPFVLSGRLKSMPPPVLNGLVSHLVSRGRAISAEEAIIGVDTESLDIPKALQICLSQRLFSAMLHVQSKAAGIYVPPLANILDFVVGQPDVSPGVTLRKWKPQPKKVDAGMLLLAYTGACLRGLNYPEGTPILPEAKARAVQRDVATFLFTLSAPPDKRVYPILFYLLSIDCHKCLDALSGLFKSDVPPSSVAFPLDKDAMAAALFEVAIDPDASATDDSHWRFSTAEQSAVLQFLSKLFARNCVSPKCCDPPKFQAIINRFGMHEASEWLYAHRRMFGEAVRARSQDPQRQKSVFDLVRELVGSKQLSPEELAELKAKTVEILPALVAIDSSQAVKMASDCFGLDHATVATSLSAQDKFRYLSGVFSIEGRKAAAQTGVQLPFELHESFIELMCKFSPTAVAGYLESCDDYPLDSTLKVCQRYRIASAIVLLLERAGDVTGAMNVLIAEAETRLQALKALYLREKRSPSSSSSSASTSTAVPDEERLAEESVKQCILLCTRNSNRLNEPEAEALWFRLLDTVVLPLRASRETWKSSTTPSQQQQPPQPQQQDARLQAFLSRLTQTILDSMMGYVAMPLILSRILRDHGKDEFGNFKSIVLGMLDSFAFERNILQTTAHMLNQDVFDATKSFVHQSRRAIRPVSQNCARCGGAIISQNRHEADMSSAIVFGCGHAYHSRCCSSHRCIVCTRDTPVAKKRGAMQIPRQLADALTSGDLDGIVPLEDALSVSAASSAPAPSPAASASAQGSAQLYQRRLRAFDRAASAAAPQAPGQLPHQQQHQQHHRILSRRSSQILSLPPSPQFSVRLEGFERK